MPEEKYYVWWIDSNDWDAESNNGFEEFEEEEELLEWAVEHPNLILKIVKGTRVKLRPVEVVTKFEIDEDWEADGVLEN